MDKCYKNNNKIDIENYPTATIAKSEPQRINASQALKFRHQVQLFDLIIIIPLNVKKRHLSIHIHFGFS